MMRRVRMKEEETKVKGASQKSELESTARQKVSEMWLYSRLHFCRKNPLCKPLSSLPQNFLDNFPSSDIMVFVARTFLLFQMITVYPLLGYLVRVQMMGQIFGNNYPR